MKTNKKKTFLVLKIICVFVFIAGACVFSYPFVREYIDIRHAEELSAEFDQKTKSLADNSDSKILTELWDELETYNLRLATSGQDKMRDVLSYESFAVDISKYNLPDNMFGYLEIPRLERKYSIYLGSSRNNMAKGATVLGETSAPIGGKNTHCVIAAHSAWAGVVQFRKIHTLSEGDQVIVTNPWETLTYQVIGHKQIKPDEFNDLIIQKDKDLLTLFTCYPNNKSRWCVFCERVK